MNGDQQSNEILRALGSLEGTVKSLVEGLNEHQEDLKAVRSTCQRFEDYREARKELPDKVAALQIVANDYVESKRIRDEKYAEITFLKDQYKIAVALGAAFWFLIGILAFVISRGWLHWTV